MAIHDSFDDLFDDVVPLAEAAQELPGRPHTSTLLRWGKGIRGVKLSLLRIGARHYVSRRALKEFIAALTAATEQPSCSQPTVTHRRSQLENAERELNSHFDPVNARSRKPRKTHPPP